MHFERSPEEIQNSQWIQPADVTHQSKGVTAQPRDNHFAAQFTFKPFCNRLQQPVSLLVTQRIIDFGKIVNIQYGYGIGAAAIFLRRASRSSHW